MAAFRHARHVEFLKIAAIVAAAEHQHDDGQPHEAKKLTSHRRPPPLKESLA